MRKELRIGIIVEAIYIISNRFFNVPDLFLGMLAGLTICFLFIGVLPEKRYLKIKDWKISMFKRL